MTYDFKRRKITAAPNDFAPQGEPAREMVYRTPEMGTTADDQWFCNQLIEREPSQKRPDEIAPARAKKTIGSHLPLIRLRAAHPTTSNQPLPNSRRRSSLEGT